MTGYYKQDNSDQFDEDGWLKTGDVVYYDEDYCFFIVDRIKHILIYRGWHIVPAFLEQELLNHPAVEKAAVVGIPHGPDEEHPLAVVTLRSNLNDTISVEIENYLNEKLSQEYELRIGVKVVNKIPSSATGKLKRQELKRMIASGEI